MTRPRRALALVAVITAAAAAGCSSSRATVGTGTASSPPSSSSTIAQPAPIIRAPVLGVVQLTSADSGSFAVHLGQSIQLTLSDQAMQWGPVKDSPAGLLFPIASQPAPMPRGQVVIWKAAKPGIVRITAAGTPNCAPGAVCAMWARLFAVTLIIS